MTSTFKVFPYNSLMHQPPKPEKPYTTWDDFKYGIGFPLAVALWVGGLGYAVIALLF